MNVFVGEDGAVELVFQGKVWLRGLDLHLRRAGKVLTLCDFQAGPWIETQQQGKRVWRRRLSLDGGEILEHRVVQEGQVLRVEAEFLTEFSGLQGSLDYMDPAVVLPVFLPSPELFYFLCTFGLDGAAGEFPGGYWPEARVGKVAEGFPKRPWAPLVLWGEGGALALAPGELFLTSPFVPWGEGFGRALAGDFPAIPKGTVLSTWIAWGESPEEALLRLGEILKGGAPENKWEAAPLLSHLGYWNAYGSYYTELIHPIEGKTLLALADEFREKKIPVGYFGLDLWYPYERISRAKVFRPDPRKYPDGLRVIREKTGFPFVLHLSALSKENLYRSDGTDPSVYEEIAEEVRREGGVAVWHDWLRTWQFVTPELLADPWAAENWFRGMCRAFREAGLPVLLCMQTMGMVLASVREPNVVSGRSYTDHLFSQRIALDKAKATEPGIEKAWTRSVDVWQQNLLVGFVQWAFGLRPFHDLFLSSFHEGFGGERAGEEATLRALSCGPVGFGDALRKADRKLLGRLILPQGLLAQPEHPPIPIWSSLFTETPQFWSARRAGEVFWVYWIVLNLGKEERRVRVELPLSNDFLVWDPWRKELTSDLVPIPPEGLAYRVLLPVRKGIGLLGLSDLLVPAPSRLAWEVRWEGKWVWEVSRDGPFPWALRGGRIVPAEEVLELRRRET